MATCSINNDIELTNFICPICYDLLLDPIMASDGIIYNKKCFMKYAGENTVVRSPIKGVKINTKFMYVSVIKNIITNLIINTNIFDVQIKNMTTNNIVHFGLENVLRQAGKIPTNYYDEKEYYLQNHVILDLIEQINNMTNMTNMNDKIKSKQEETIKII